MFGSSFPRLSDAFPTSLVAEAPFLSALCVFTTSSHRITGLIRIRSTSEIKLLLFGLGSNG